MKRALLLLMVTLLVTLSGIAFAAAPLPGAYQSTDIGGVIPPGRYTEGWAAGGSALTVGATLYCQSWDGVTLGTIWSYHCAVQTANSVLQADNVDGSGNGTRTYKSIYVGGTFNLSGAGPWGNGDANYPGTWDSYYEIETVIYAAFVPIAAVTNVSAIGHFDNYPTACMDYTISNGSRVGTTDLGNVKPPNYPGLYDFTTCLPTQTLGAWWNMNSMTVVITPNCTVPTKPATWGAIKTLYR